MSAKVQLQIRLQLQQVGSVGWIMRFTLGGFSCSVHVRARLREGRGEGTPSHQKQLPLDNDG